MLDPSSLWRSLRSSVGDPHPFRPSLGSEPVTECPPRTFRPTAADSQPAAACHDHSPAHHGYIHHHRNDIVTGHGQSSRAQFYQRGQLCLVINKSSLLCHFAPVNHCRFYWFLYYLCSSPQTLMSGSNPMLGTGLNLSGLLPTGGLMPTMQSAAQAGKKLHSHVSCNF